jgi:hypothetical protein
VFCQLRPDQRLDVSLPSRVAPKSVREAVVKRFREGTIEKDESIWEAWERQYPNAVSLALKISEDASGWDGHGDDLRVQYPSGKSENQSAESLNLFD